MMTTTATREATYTNSEGERIAIERREMHGRTPVFCLVIYDDPPPTGTGRPAPMLLDRGTRDWLRAEMDNIDT